MQRRASAESASAIIHHYSTDATQFARAIGEMLVHAVVIEPGAALFDHLVGAGEKRWRKVEPDCLRCPEVHDQFEFGRLFDR